MKSEAEQDREAKERTAAVQAANAALATVYQAIKRENAAKAELGTAQAELGKAWAGYMSARNRLEKRLPDIPVAAVVEVRAPVVGRIETPKGPVEVHEGDEITAEVEDGEVVGLVAKPPEEAAGP